MKVSEITPEAVNSYLRLDDDADDGLASVMLPAAVAYVKGYTGLDAAALDEHEDISLAVLVLCSDMYDNRQMVVDNDKVNRVIQSILDMHRVNLL